MSRSPNRPASRGSGSGPKQPSKAEELRRFAKGSFKWAQVNAWVTAVGVLVAIAAIVIPLVLTSTSHAAPPGILVNVVPQDRFGGAPVYPTDTGAMANAWLNNSWSLRVDCVQLVKPSSFLAHIADGPYQNHWIDTFDLKTARGDDVGYPMLPPCGPPVDLTPTP